MARLALNKTSLHREMQRLKLFRRYLPSLDLKRRRLVRELQAIRERLAEIDRALADDLARARTVFPMLGESRFDLRGLVAVERVDRGEEFRAGVPLPTVVAVALQRSSYSLLTKPHWVDELADRLAERLDLLARRAVEVERMEIMETAVRKITQRVNLFEKVLIPRAEDHVRRIRTAIADTERAGVVRSKIAKAKHSARAEREAPGSREAAVP